MAWLIEFSDEADHDFARLDKAIQLRTFRYLHERIASSDNPRDFGKRLRHELAALGRYRVGDYRILCAIEDEKLTVPVVEIGHRSTVYDR